MYIIVRAQGLIIQPTRAAIHNDPISRPIPSHQLIPYDLFAKLDGPCVDGPSGVTYAYLLTKRILLD